MGNFYKATRQETAFPVSHYVNSNGVLTGATVVLQIRDGASDDSYLDFNDGLFKSSGWTTKSLTVTEVVAGLHVVDGGVDFTGFTLPAGNFLQFEYSTTKTGLTWIDADTVLLEDNLSERLQRLDTLNIQTRLFYAVNAIDTGTRRVPVGAASHMSVESRLDGAAFTGTAQWYVWLSYATGATKDDGPATSTVPTVAATAPTDGTFSSEPGFPS